MHKKSKKSIRKILRFVFIVIFFIGLGIFLFPYINGAILEWNNKADSKAFLLLHEELAFPKKEVATEEPPEHKETIVPKDIPYWELRAAAESYNNQIFKEEQALLKGSSTSYEEPCLILADYGLPNEIFAVIKIPRLKVEMPVYLGANEENLSSGAAQMSQTSLPIGGNNSNCVIAAHRGWKGANYFRYIPNLENGDEISITNLWETLTYRVVDEQIIYSTESPYIYIQEGKDLITLLTCEYSVTGAKYRYIVICERVLS